MKKIAFLISMLGALFAANLAFAFSGSHSFLSMNSSSSNGHSYVSQFVSTGSFPFNGKGNSDNSKVNLKGIVTVSQKDGVAVSESYCATLTGNLKPNSGRLSAVVYTDTTCTQVASKSSFAVSSYKEDSLGNFIVVAKDSKGVVWTTTGTHNLQY